MKYPLLSDPHLYQISQGFGGLFAVQSVHPTQLYELVAALTMSFLAVFILWKGYKDGTAIFIGAAWFTIFRFVNHFLRANADATRFELWFYPVLYMALFAVSIVLLKKLVINKDK